MKFGDELQSLLGGLLALVIAVIGFFLPIIIYLAVVKFVRHAVHYWQDYSTGFIRMKERIRQGAVQQLEETMRGFVDDVYGKYGLALGLPESLAMTDKLVLPGEYRPTHIYVVGASGSGKSSLLKNLLIQDLRSSIGMCVIDPHGDLVHDILPFLHKRKDETLLLDLGDTEHMLPYNPLERRAGVLVSEQVAKLVLAFKRIWGDSWGPRMEDILRHTLALLIEHGYTLNEFERVLTDGDFRAMLCERSMNEQATDFFEGRFNTWNAKERALFIESSLNKVSAFLADERIGLRLSSPKSAFNLKDVMDNGGVLLVNLAKGRLAGNADLFGALLMADLETSFLSRPPSERTPFAVYVDEFQNIATDSFGTVLAEARKFNICLTMAHQSLKQLDDKLVSLILGNAQTQIYFRVARQDAERLAKESVNIVEEIIEADQRLIQQPETKHNLPELWEIAFNRLAQLPQRMAYVMVRGAMDRPELIQTEDNPIVKKVEFDYTDLYCNIGEFQRLRADSRKQLDTAIEMWLEEQEQAKPTAKAVVAEPPAIGDVE